ncbi:MAG: SUMF1/EgtB/PvdO family nonheme iron enzyme [Candidatus Thiodiazotropha taylori]
MNQVFHHALRVGAILNQYEIRGVLGAGGFGLTYQAWDTMLECPVAIKEYMPNELAMRQEGSTNVIPRSSTDEENYQYGLDGFLKEARTLAKFKEPNIVRVSNFLKANGTAYMVMDYEEGEPLSALLEREGTLDEATLKNLMIPILDGLRAVHREQFLHRDIKPGNIYLRSEGSPVLLDFGAARQALGEHSRSMTGIVTAGYAPFEQYSSRGKQGSWTDLYAIGATMYRAISGHPPVESSERVAAVGEGDPDPLVPATEVGKGRYSEPLLSSIDWMLSLAAKDRPQSVEAVLERLLGRTAAQPAATPTPPSKSTETAPPPTATPPQPKKSSAWPLGIGVLVLALLGMGSWAYLNGQNKTEVQPTAPTTTTIRSPATTTQSASGTAQTDPQPSPPPKTPGKTVATANPQPVEPPPALVGHLQINVNATDANIRLDGQPVGIASPGKPLNLEGLQLGTHKIEVEAAGYQALSESTQVQAQQWTQMAIQLKPVITTGELIVRSNVSGDTVYINGKAFGSTGKNSHKLAAGDYIIRIKKTGYEDWEQSIQLKAGIKQVVRADLVPEKGELIISSDPSDVTVSIDGQSVGGIGTYKLTKGTYLIRITKVGYKPYEKRIMVKSDQKKVLTTKLIAESQPKLPNMLNILGGRFEMGSSSADKQRRNDEQQHWVTVKDFKLAQTEITQSQWFSVMGNNPSLSIGCDDCPVERVSWFDIQEYIRKLNQYTGKRYRLPTEAEWEYACRGGQVHRYCGGDGLFGLTVGEEVRTVGTTKPNGYGLYDMTGNVSEWTCSEYDKEYGGDELQCSNKRSNYDRAVRGGSFQSYSYYRATSRNYYRPNAKYSSLGFRLAHD